MWPRNNDRGCNGNGSRLAASASLSAVKRLNSLEPQPIPGLLKLSGKVIGLAESELESLLGQEVTLVLEDQRTLTIRLKPNGVVVPMGPLSAPSS